MVQTEGFSVEIMTGQNTLHFQIAISRCFTLLSNIIYTVAY